DPPRPRQAGRGGLVPRHQQPGREDRARGRTRPPDRGPPAPARLRRDAGRDCGRPQPERRRRVTGDERGLLRGVLDSPGDLTAKLVYADWLDDRGDPRGPWLRAVCAGRDADELRGVDPDSAALLDGPDHST